MGHLHGDEFGPGPFPKWKTWTRAIAHMPMGHFYNDELGPGPFNLGPWVTSTVENIDQDHQICAHRPFVWW